MNKAELKSGMFGVMSDGAVFVLVNELIVYQDGEYDFIKTLTPDWEFSERRIEKLYEGINSFGMLEVILDQNGKIPYSNVKCIFDSSKFTEMTIAEIEAKLGIKNLKIIKE